MHKNFSLLAQSFPREREPPWISVVPDREDSRFRGEKVRPETGQGAGLDHYVAFI